MTPAILLAALTLAGAFLFIAHYAVSLRPRPGTLDWVSLQERPPFTFAVKRHPVEKKDALPILLITAVYAFTAFFSLGSTTAPQTVCDLSSGEPVTIQVLGDPIYVSKLRSYGALGTGRYNIEVSKDGKSWSTLWTRTEQDQWGRDVTAYYWADAAGYAPHYALSQDYIQLFKWQEVTPDNPQYVQYIRLTGKADRDTLQLCKLVFLDQSDQLLRFNWGMADGSPIPAELEQLFAVDETVPQEPSWMDSTYFDEIYHPRTALEHIQGRYPYEITHPPLGKLIIGLGIRAFGMTPFGWRFMGTLFGTLMVPLFYLLLKNLFGKTNLAACGTVLLSTEFMHLTQTRIATIDTYGVFFILLSTFFFYRWLTASATPTKRGKHTEGYGSLALSGLAFGVGCACKWTVVYAGAGLAVLYVIHMVLRVRSWDRDGSGRSLWPWLCKTLLVSVLCFVVIPGCIYTLSYLPYAQAAGNPGLRGAFEEMWANQSYMLHYHEGVHDPHPYSSRWYQWLVDARPILYYSKDLPGGFTQRFAAFNNPLTAWAGLLSLIAVAVRFVQRRSGKALLIVVGFLAQFLPWVLISRITFAYHYFPSTLFLILAICYVWNDLMECPWANWRGAVYGLTGASAVLYALFYPVLIGLAIPAWYSSDLLRFLPSWPL